MSAGELAKRGSSWRTLGCRGRSADADEQRKHEGDSDVHPPERVQYNLEKHDENFYELADIYALGLMIWEGLYYVRHGEAVSCAQAIMSECHEGQDVLIRISSGTFVPPCDFFAGADTAVPAQVLAREAVAEVSEHDRRAQRVGESAQIGQLAHRS